MEPTTSNDTKKETSRSALFSGVDEVSGHTMPEEKSALFSFAGNKNDEPEGDLETGLSSASVPDEEDVMQSQALTAESQRSDIVDVGIVSRREELKVKSFKGIFAVLLVCITCVNAAMVYHFARRIEDERFHNQFAEDAENLLTSFRGHMDIMTGALDTLMIDLVSEAESTDQQWPFVTVPHFSICTAKLRRLSGLVYINLLPLVTSEQRLEWEAYSLEHQGWVNESIKIQETDDTYRGPVTYNKVEPVGVIHTNDLEVVPYNNDSNKLLLPGWQSGQVAPGYAPFNYDYLSVTNPSAIHAALESQTVVVTEATMLPNPDKPEEVVETESWCTWFSYFVPNKDTACEPMSHMLYPILDDPLDSIRVNSTEQNVVGFLTGAWYWRDILTDVLSRNSGGRSITVVFRNECSPTFTYKVNGPTVEYVGRGDFHEPKFEDSVVSSQMYQEGVPEKSSAYTGIPINEEYCPFNIDIYPTQASQDHHYTNAPIIFMLCTALMFAFTTAAFLAYDCAVEKRQKVFLKTTKSNQLRAQVQRERSKLEVKSSQEVARAQRELNDFIAHEVRNPLAAAMSACSFVESATTPDQQPLLAADPERQKALQDDIGIIDSSLHFINDLLRSMLDFQRAKSSQLSLDTKPIHLLHDVLQPVESMFHLRGTNIQIQVACTPEDLMVKTDPLRLKQILVNLTRNSIKFVVDRGFIRLCAFVKDECVCLSVEDSGPGIPAEKRNQLFGKFQESLDQMNQGTGIGLSLCKSLTELLGGDIDIDGDYDSGIEGCPGTRFVINLRQGPFEMTESYLNSCAQNQHAEASEAFSEATKKDGTLSADGGTTLDENACLPEQLKVLFVDDDMVVRKMFSRSVKRVAPTWEVQEVSSGEASLHLCERETFDIIFMDQYMASVQKQLLGTETTRALRSQGVTAIICGCSANDVEESFRDAGADFFVHKPFPFKPVELRKELKRIVHPFEDRLKNRVQAEVGLGDGPMRFAPPKEYSLDQVLKRLPLADQQAFRRLQKRWESHQDRLRLKRKRVFMLPLQWHLRYLHLSAKQKRDMSTYFSVEKAWNGERNAQRRFVTLSVSKLQEQLLSKTLFPVPGLKSSGGHDMFYMRPSRYWPKETPVKTIIDNLCYVMNTMLEDNEFAQKEGIGFLACMDDWTMKNFDVTYCYQFMMALQGFKVPVKTQLFLIVNPPSWFGGIWRIMKPMLAPSFRKRVKIVPESKIAKYLAPGYEQCLPDDMQTGLANTTEIVEDFISFRQFKEKHVDDEGFARSITGSGGNNSMVPSEASSILHSNRRKSSLWSMGSMGSSFRSNSSISTAFDFPLGHSTFENDEDGASIHCDIDIDEMMDSEHMTPVEVATEDSKLVDTSTANDLSQSARKPLFAISSPSPPEHTSPLFDSPSQPKSAPLFAMTKLDDKASTVTELRQPTKPLLSISSPSPPEDSSPLFGSPSQSKSAPLFAITKLDDKASPVTELRQSTKPLFSITSPSPPEDSSLLFNSPSQPKSAPLFAITKLEDKASPVTEVGQSTKPLFSISSPSPPENV